MATLCFLHGLESGPIGSKTLALQAAFGAVLAPDCRGLFGIEQRLHHIEAELAAVDDELVLVGSSFGGLMAALVADRQPQRVRATVLLAPALHAPGVETVHRVPAFCRILHAPADDVVPFAASVTFGARLGVPVEAVEDDHRLSASRARIVALTAEALAFVAARDAASPQGRAYREAVFFEPWPWSQGTNGGGAAAGDDEAPDGPWAVVTAFDPPGAARTAAANADADAALATALRQRGLSPLRVTGGSRDGRHREPGFAARLERDEALALARRFDQAAFFEIDRGQLRLVWCDDGSVEPLGAARSRFGHG